MRRLALALALSVVLAAGPTFAQQTPAPPAAPAPAPAPAVQVPLQAPAAVEPFPAGVKYAFVNVQRIANESAAGKVATAQVNALVQKKQAESAERTKTLQAAQQKLDAGGTVLSDVARAQLQKEIERQSIDIQRFTEDAQQEVQQLQQQLQLEFQQKLSPVIEAVAKERELHMIFSVVDSGLVWGHASLDLTTEVIQKFDAQPAARPAAQAPSAPAQPRPAAPRPAAPAPATPR
jgi:Skp family chaperone for outer membrane proteins